MNLGVPWIPRRAHGRVASPAAEGKLDEMSLAQNDHPYRAQALRCGRSLLRDTVGTTLGTSGRHAAADMHQILDRDRKAVERPVHSAGSALLVGFLCRGERFVAIDLDEAVQSPVELRDTLQILGDDLAR